MSELTPGWQVVVDVGPEWLFFRLVGDGPMIPSELPLAEAVWVRASREGINRLVFELQPNLALTSALVGQMILLHKRAELSHGVFRLCGLTDEQHRVLRMMRLGDRFPNYATREDAVLGRVPQ